MGIVGDSDESVGKRRTRLLRKDVVPSSATSIRTKKWIDWRGTIEDAEARGRGGLC